MDALEHNPPRLRAAKMDIAADLSPTGRQRVALQDIADGWRLWRLGATLGWLDIKLRYRGSLIGPFWLTISTAVWIGAMGGIYGALFHMDLQSYLPFLALSLVLWTALGGLVSDACNTFVQSESTIRSLRMPFFVHVLRVVVRTAIAFSHNVPVILGVFAIYRIWPGATLLLCLPGLALWTLDAFALCLLLGSFCARFRDIPPIVASIMQIAFFITPIMWRPDQLGARGWWLPFNPFDALIEIVRAPLLGQIPAATAWGMALGYSLVLLVASWALFVRVRTRLAYWM